MVVGRGFGWKNYLRSEPGYPVNMSEGTASQHRTRWLLRGLFILLALSPLVFSGQFLDHFQVHFTGEIVDTVITLKWHVVALNILLFVSFLVPLSYRRTVDWKEYGLVSAFFVSLFIEMSGIPLILLFVSGRFGGSESGVALPENAVNFSFLGVNFSMTHAMVYGLVLMTLGTVLIILGWITLYRHLEKDGDGLVTSGIYAYSRHPQYFGFILVILGWFFGWPTILVLVFAPILVYKYLKVCTVEEKELEEDVDYQAYREKVPFFL